jgi:type VI secretion system protein ImpG
MSDELLPYYNRELRFLREMGARFAEAHPKIAGRLRLTADAAEDPHVARMIEAFAYLNARTRFKLEDDFPEISEALLNVLYPHYLAPVPSAAIAEFALDRAQAELTSGYTIPQGEMVETEPIDGEPCRFRTCYPVTLWPVEVANVSLKGQPFTAPLTRLSADAVAVLRVVMDCYSTEASFAQLELDHLRWYLHGSPPLNFELYEVLLNNTTGVAVCSSSSDQEAVILGPECLQLVGFGRDEGLVDYPARSFMGYRLLSEYFAFSEKFLFFDLQLPRRALADAGHRLELYFYLNRHTEDLERFVDAGVLRLGCCPIVNLFRQQAEPIRLTHHEYDHRVVPDARRPLAFEVYSIDRVVATSPDNEQSEYQPFYCFKHGRDARRQRTFWHASRRPAAEKPDVLDTGTEVFLSLVDLDFSPAMQPDWTVTVQTTCLNRDLPRQLPFGGGQPKLHLPGGAPVSHIACLTRPKPTRRPALRHGTRWRLISHLTLNHLSLMDYEEGADALREILALYDFADTAETRSMIEGLVNVHSRRVVGRVGGDVSAGLTRGVEVTLRFDEDKFSGGGVYLFATVLERFLGLYSSVNSFTRTIATTNQREGELCRWPPRAGETVLL